MSNVVIRPAREADLVFLAAIEREAASLFPPDRIPPASATVPLDQLHESIALNLLFVAEKDKAIVGFASCRECDNYLHLDEMSVHPSHGRRGIGKSLVLSIVEEARERSVLGITLTTFADIIWNAPFYNKVGFTTLKSHELPKHVRKQLESERLLGMKQRIGMVRNNIRNYIDSL